MRHVLNVLYLVSLFPVRWSDILLCCDAGVWRGGRWATGKTSEHREDSVPFIGLFYERVSSSLNLQQRRAIRTIHSFSIRLSQESLLKSEIKQTQKGLLKDFINTLRGGRESPFHPIINQCSASFNIVSED